MDLQRSIIAMSILLVAIVSIRGQDAVRIGAPVGKLAFTDIRSCT